MENNNKIHNELRKACKELPEDYEPYGEISNDERGGDCSCDCKFAVWLEGDEGLDWCVCINPKSHRYGLLTFEHQAGANCFKGAKKHAKKED